MAFARAVKGRELAVMTKLLSIFGIVEARQMRQLFDHLSDKQYGQIMAKLDREGLVYHPPGGKYLTTSRFSVEKSHIPEAVKSFWAFISVRDNVLDFCASDPPAMMAFTSGETDYELVPIAPKSLKLLESEEFEPEERTVRLFVVGNMDELAGVETRIKNDYAIEVGPDGETKVYEL